MTQAERRAFLGPETVAELDRMVVAAPPPSAEQIALLQRIFAQHPASEQAQAA